MNFSNNDHSDWMATARKDFMDLLEELSGNRMGASAPLVEESRDMSHESPMSNMHDDYCDEGIGSELADDNVVEDHPEDFPGRRFFDPRKVDYNDPRFASGVELGIPIAVVVRYNDGQNKLIPIGPDKQKVL